MKEEVLEGVVGAPRDVYIYIWLERFLGVIEGVWIPFRLLSHLCLGGRLCGRSSFLVEAWTCRYRRYPYIVPILRPFRFRGHFRVI